MVSVTNSLASLFPEIASEWHPTKNGDITPAGVVAGSNKKFWWRCKADNEHEWETAPVWRTGPNKTGCPFCSLRPRSKQEIYLAFELSEFIDFDISKQIVEICGNPVSADIVIDKYKIIVEFDGSYWHRDKEKHDLEKTEMLIDAGWQVVRAREQPLKEVGPYDIVVPFADTKACANLVLLKIHQVFGIKMEGLFDYLKKPVPTNKRKAELFIEKLLNDKDEDT